MPACLVMVFLPCPGKLGLTCVPCLWEKKEGTPSFPLASLPSLGRPSHRRREKLPGLYRLWRRRRIYLCFALFHFLSHVYTMACFLAGKRRRLSLPGELTGKARRGRTGTGDRQAGGQLETGLFLSSLSSVCLISTYIFFSHLISYIFLYFYILISHIIYIIHNTCHHTFPIKQLNRRGLLPCAYPPGMWW